MRRRIKIVKVRSEIGAGTRGASLGVDAVQGAALDAGSKLFATRPADSVKTENQLLYGPAGSPFAKRIRGMVTVHGRVRETISRTLRAGYMPLVLAGDHATAAGTIAGIRTAYPSVRLGIVWIDAHADLHTPYTTPSGNLHGMPVAAALGEDNRMRAIHRPDARTLRDWHVLSPPGPGVRAEDLVYVALRSYEKEEEALIRERSIKAITPRKVRAEGAENTAEAILRYLKEVKLIYISFDVDSLDPSISTGTGTPVAGGLTEKQAGDLLWGLMQDPRICCFEIAEINPLLDNENRMGRAAFRILSKALETVKPARQKS